MEPQHRNKVLIVDNNQCALDAFKQVFARVGFDTRTTWSGREALELLGSQEFDVLLVDDYLPDLHACEFSEPRRPVAGTAVDCRDAGGDAHDQRCAAVRIARRLFRRAQAPSRGSLQGGVLLLRRGAVGKDLRQLIVPSLLGAVSISPAWTGYSL